MRITYRKVNNTEKAKAAVVLVGGDATQLYAVREDTRAPQYNLYFMGTDDRLYRLTTWYWKTRQELQADIEKRLAKQYQEAMAEVA